MITSPVFPVGNWGTEREATGQETQRQGQTAKLRPLPGRSLRAAVAPPLWGVSKPGPAPPWPGPAPPLRPRSRPPQPRFLPAPLGGRPAHLAAPTGRRGEAAQTRWSRARAGPPAACGAQVRPRRGRGCAFLPARPFLTHPGRMQPPRPPRPPPPAAPPGTAERIRALGEPAPTPCATPVKSAPFWELFSPWCKDSWTLTSWTLALPHRDPKQDCGSRGSFPVLGVDITHLFTHFQSVSPSPLRPAAPAGRWPRAPCCPAHAGAEAGRPAPGRTSRRGTCWEGRSPPFLG